jgi:diphthine-ammonia ligase
METETVIHSDSDFATVAFLKIKKAELVSKQSSTPTAQEPPLLENLYLDLEETVNHAADDDVPLKKPIDLQLRDNLPPVRQFDGRPWIVLGGIQCSYTGLSIEDTVQDCFQQVTGQLHTYVQLPIAHHLITS